MFVVQIAQAVSFMLALASIRSIVQTHQWEMKKKKVFSSEYMKDGTLLIH